MNATEEIKAAKEKSAHAKLSRFARRLLVEWRRLGLPETDERIVIAVSGGADSTALLLAFDELIKANRFGLSVTVAHLNHELRGRSSAEDAAQVAELAISLGYEIEAAHISVKERADALRDNLEQAARRARYEFLEQAAKKIRAQSVLTGHTLDDQAETVLLRLLRGSAAEGLSGMETVRFLNPEKSVLLVRPLLRWARRADTECYCRIRRVEFCVDETNADERFARVRVRRKLLPLLQTFNPRVAETLARTADLLREDAAVLQTQAALLLNMAQTPDDAPSLYVAPLAAAPPALRRRALRQWIEREAGSLRRLELVHITAIERLLAGERGGRVVELPNGARIERRGQQLIFRCAVKG